MQAHSALWARQTAREAGKTNGISPTLLVYYSTPLYGNLLLFLYRVHEASPEEMDSHVTMEGEILDCGNPASYLSAVRLLLSSWCVKMV